MMFESVSNLRVGEIMGERQRRQIGSTSDTAKANIIEIRKS